MDKIFRIDLGIVKEITEKHIHRIGTCAGIEIGIPGEMKNDFIQVRAGLIQDVKFFNDAQGFFGSFFQFKFMEAVG